MQNLFPIAVIALFIGASAVSLVTGSPAKGMFYLLSALINLNVLFLK